MNRGVKAGGFNAPATFGSGFPAGDIPYGAEVLTAYETGFKRDGLFGGTTRLNGSFYFYNYQGYQGFFFTQVTGYVQERGRQVQRAGARAGIGAAARAWTSA